MAPNDNDLNSNAEDKNQPSTDESSPDKPPEMPHQQIFDGTRPKVRKPPKQMDQTLPPESRAPADIQRKPAGKSTISLLLNQCPWPG